MNISPAWLPACYAGQLKSEKFSLCNWWIPWLKQRSTIHWFQPLNHSPTHSVKHLDKLQTWRCVQCVDPPNLETIIISPQSYLLQRLVDDHFPCLDHGPWPIRNVIVPNHFVNLRGLCHSHRVQTNLHTAVHAPTGPGDFSSTKLGIKLSLIKVAM